MVFRLLRVRSQVCRPVREAFVSLFHEFLRGAAGKNVDMCGVRRDMLAGALGHADLIIEGSAPFVAVHSGGAYGGRRLCSRMACGRV